MTRNTGTGWRAPACIATVVCAAVLLAPATAAASPTNDDCLMCHDDPTAARENGRSVYVPAKAFEASVHSGLSCTDCHADLVDAEFPHPEKLAKVDCSVCHDDAVEAYGKSIHAKAREAGTLVAATCVDCHGTHDILPSTDPKSPTYPLNLPNTCGKCHGNPKIIAEGHIKIGNVFVKYQDSIHGRVLQQAGLLVSAKCTDCHGHHDILPKSDPDSRVFRTNVPGTCGHCHGGILTLYDKGIHGTLLAKGDAKVPVCSDCHTAHEIMRTDIPAWKLDVLKECGSCHEQSMRSYRDTFHGQVTNLGFTRTASCSDCHGAHDILPESDPGSRISSAHRVQTCAKCHPGANRSFARYDPHADKRNRERNPQLYWAARFMQLLLGGVFVFFGLHTSLWFQRILRGDKPAPPKKAPPRKEGD